MLFITPEIEEILQWWHSTHVKVAFPDGSVEWQLARLPRSGSIGEQDQRLMAELEVVTDVKNQQFSRVVVKSGIQEL